jgi:uncharacterized protein (TIGR03790 family)
MAALLGHRPKAPVLLLRLCWLFLMTLAGCGGGGGGSDSDGGVPPPLRTLGPADLAVLVAQGDATSEAIALEYQQKRGIPAANMVALAVPTGSDVITSTAFAALKANLDARLPGSVQATLVTWTRPSRVYGPSRVPGEFCYMSLTSALAFGFDARYCGQCSATQASPYYNSESGAPFTDLGLRPSMMLGASTLEQARVLIARGVAADGSRTNIANATDAAHAWLVRTSDEPRSQTRYPDFQLLASIAVAGVAMHYVDNSAGTASDLVVNQRSVMFYLTGLGSVDKIATNTYLPGAVADHLTSWAGILPDARGQMPATAWLDAGATASYGTVEEPCNKQEKFPRASLLVARYARGETLIEAYWKSVQWPGQGLFLGEPLAQPWKR